METNPFESAIKQINRAAAVRKTSSEVLKRLSRAERELTVSIPITMDDGSVQIFEGYRVQHSSLRGPYKGGIRFHPQADINEVRALAFWMMIKTAVAGIPMGGGKGGITLDPRVMSKGELERVSRGWVKRMYPVLGPKQDVPAPDVNTNGEIMMWMTDEYEKLTADMSGATFTGKPVGRGGSEGREVATGLGGFHVFDALREKLGLPEYCTVVVQGMGNVGGNAAKIFAQHGHTIIAMSDSKGGIYNEKGLNPKDVETYKKEHGSLKGFPGAKQISNAKLLELKCDVLIPAALENQITRKNAKNIQAKAVLELANGPTTPEADDMLFKKKIPVIPDVLANSGGVVVSTFEWEQNLKGEHWSETEVLQKLKDILERESNNVFVQSKKLKTDLRRGAFALALERLEEAV